MLLVSSRLYPAEVNSLKFRTKGAALATACDWLFNYAVVQTTPLGIHHLNWGLYLIYALFNATFVPLVHYLVVETQGQSLEDTDRWFEDHPRWIVHKVDLHTAEDGLNGHLLHSVHDAEANSPMTETFEMASDSGDDRSLPNSPVTRRGSYPVED